jgi:glycosyltransferase involved in cell wall biosynthesis
MSGSEPLISVIIPTYNRASAVCEAVRSAARQTYSNVEIIVVDDGSTDDTLARLAQFGDSIKVISAANGGVAAARNRGINVAKGELLAFLDSDDTWLPSKLETQMNALSELGEEFDACFTDCRFTGNPDLRFSAFEEAGLKSQVAGALDNPFSWILGRYTPIYVQSLVVSRSTVRLLDGFDESLPVGEDTDFLFRLALRSRLCLVPSKLVEIDRTPSRSVGLMEMYYRRSERMYRSRKYMFQKWLATPELSDRTTRRAVQEHLREILYQWTITNLYQRSLFGALNNMMEIRATGDSYFGILTTLLRRALRKVGARFGG